ncbi:MAG: hypothetical protein PVF66_11080 [Candidatus Aminicenantes bacterium]|jgi:hypothetical protein
MKFRKHSSLVLLSGLIFSLILSPSLDARGANQGAQADKSKPIIIPDAVKKIFEEGISTRETRQDIPFTIVQHLCLPDFPVRTNLHNILYFRVKNADLGFAPLTAGLEPEKKKKEEETQSIFQSTASRLQARAHVFLQFNRMENNAVEEVAREVYIPVMMQVDGSSYEPDKEELYTARNLMPPGNYLLSMAIASADLKRIGTQYLECSIPDESSFTDRLETTPILLVSEMKQMPSRETKAAIHKGSFTFIIYEMGLNLERVFSPGDTLELFFYILGAQPGEGGQYAIEINFEVFKGEEIAIRYAPGTYTNPLVQQSLPLVQRVVIKSESGEKEETRELEAGKHVLSMKITDKVSGYAVEKKVEFEIVK